MQRRGKLTGEQATIEAQLAKLHHRKFTLEAERAVTVNRNGARGDSTLPSPGPAKT
jgi:hypothetical protein